MKLPTFLRGFHVVALQEFLGNLRSVRLIIMAVVLGLVVVGSAYGFSAIGGGGFGSPPPIIAWGHPSLGPGGEHIAVVWVSDPFGRPFADRRVTFTAVDGAVEEPLGEVRTDAEGFARLGVSNHTAIKVLAESGTASYSTGVFYGGPPPYNFTTSNFQYDLDGDGVYDDVGFHVLYIRGNTTAAALYVNGTPVTNVDARGYALLVLPPGSSNVTVEVAGEREVFYFSVFRGTGPTFSSGPDFVLILIAAGFAGFVIPIFAVVITFDAVSKERLQGTLDLLLSRPSSRVGILLGKFLGSFAAVAVPVTAVNLAGIGVLTLASGKSPTGGFATAFVGLSLLLIAFYVLLQLTFSTLAKTSGTAVLFGVLIVLAFNLLYPVITFILGGILFAADPAARFAFDQASGLANPTSIYQQLLLLSAPEGLRRFGPAAGTSLDVPAVATAAAVWFAGLLALAVWTFRKRAAE